LVDGEINRLIQDESLAVEVGFDGHDVTSLDSIPFCGMKRLAFSDALYCADSDTVGWLRRIG
jgi:hypothetical protein